MKFFLNISDFLVQIIPEGGTPGGHNPPGRARIPGAPWWVVIPTWAPSLIPSHHIVTYLQKKFSIALSRVLALKPVDLLESPFPKLFRGIVAWYVTPPFVRLVFVLVVYILND